MEEEKKSSSTLLLRKKDLAKKLLWSRRQCELMVKSGRLPRPFYLADSSPRWREADIDAWLSNLALDAQNAEVQS